MEQKSRSPLGRFCTPIQLFLICGLSFLTGCFNAPQQTGVSPTPNSSPLPSPSIASSPLPLPPSPTPSATPSPSPTSSPSPTTEKPAEVTAVETQVKNLVAKTGNFTVQAVNCPANMSPQTSDRYDCQVQSDIGSFVVVVQPTGQAGEFRWSTKGLLLVSKLAPLIEKNFATTDSGKVNVDCGTAARIAKAGETFDCKIVDTSGTARTARVTVRDDQGNVSVTPL